MTIWDQLADHAHRLLTQPRRGDITPAVTLVSSLHPHPPHSPAEICSHMPTVSTALPQLAHHARNDDRHALLMAAVLMRHPLRRIADMADPDGYLSSNPDARNNATLKIFFELIHTAARPHVLTSRYLYNATLRTVLATRPQTATPAAALRLPPHSAVLDRAVLDRAVDDTDYSRAICVLNQARAHAIITDLEHTTLTEMYLGAEVFSPTTAAQALDATVSTIQRRAQRACHKIASFYSRQDAAA